jgi:3-hydroxy-3-methylglutaryl CoA synthase
MGATVKNSDFKITSKAATTALRMATTIVKAGLSTDSMVDIAAYAYLMGCKDTIIRMRKDNLEITKKPKRS